MISQHVVEAEERFQHGQYVEALHILNRLSNLSDNPRAINLLGDTFVRLGMLAEAAETFELHVEREYPWQLPFLKKAAVLFFALNRRDKAQLYAFRVLQIEPQSPEAAFILINVLKSPKDKALLERITYNLIESDILDHLELAYARLGKNLADGRLLELFRKLAAHKPEDGEIRRVLLAFAQEYADYDVLDAIEAGRAAGTLPPFKELALDYLFTHGGETEEREGVAYHISIPFDPVRRAARRSASHAWGKKLRIGYLSADFRPEHVVMRQFADVLRQHDRSRFEVTLFSSASQHNFDRKRFFAAFGQHVDIAALPDIKAGKEIRRRDIDILVDLGGHTANSRASLLNLGLAPVQLSWLGYPGPAVGIDVDYVIGDRFVTPETSAPYYAEKFCWMPESYMPNDPSGRRLPEAISRADHGLPEGRFIFASFNAPKKVTPRVIALWARILKAVPDSVLWTNCRTRIAEDNTVLRLRKLGIDRSRVIFAEAVRSHDDHILRLRAADLGLDTFPYNGHATTSDCLWAGLPILAMQGDNFASRVSQSQLIAMGLTDLVAADEDDYCARAVALAKAPARVAAYRATLDRNRLRAPLFDSERYCRHLEMAYEMMAARAREGLEPAHFAVPALPARAEDFVPAARP